MVETTLFLINQFLNTKRMNRTGNGTTQLLGSFLITAFLLPGCMNDQGISTDRKVIDKTSGARIDNNQFVHPGVLNSKASLDLIRSQANNGDAARLDGYSKVTEFVDANPVPTSFPATVYVKGSGSTPTENQIKTDAILSYALALRWAKTGNAIYATQAISILNGWATNFQRLLPDAGTDSRQTYLEASWFTPTFVAAAEIIRFYTVNGNSAGWSSTDISKFQGFLNNLKDNYINRLINEVNYDNNWEVSAGYAKMAVGVFLNSSTVYNGGYDYLMQNIPVIISSSGEVKEHCSRDCWHPQYSLTGFAYAAEIARIQGDNTVFPAYSSRIAKGFEYMEDAFVGAIGCRSCAGQAVFPGAEVASNYYNTSAKITSLRNRQDPYGATGDKTFLGFTTYTHRAIGR
ncbi:hypothetical protein GJR95_34855 [Spirosoma endbachense]|uniref:Alginate lyase domain-containing protein n=2 Tax=Spirosoma endbachense TaxID=2666025 RepID=A0A6P1W782_9BACT|nr:hypothetical protein GJR95_34855 [Spirosoma endbachense]